MVKILKTAFTPPNITHTIRRESLLEKLRQHQEKRLILLKAGPGFGKTVLAATYYHEVEQKVWISIPKGFFSFYDLLVYLAYALDQQIHSYESKELLECAHMMQTEELIVQIINLLSEQVTGRLYIFIDELHHLMFLEAEREKMVEIFFSFLPPNTQVILTTHNDLPFPITRFGQLGDFYQIEERLFTFTLHETKELLYKHGIVLSAEDLHQVDRLTNGWIAIIILLINELKDNSLELTEILSRTQLSAGNYIEYFVANLPKALQEFLLEISVFEFLDVELCNQYLQRTDSQALLNQLLALNIVHQKDNGFFGMHQLLRESLQRKIAPAILREKYVRLAEIALKHENMKVAVFCLINGKQIVEAVQLILELHDDRVRDISLMQQWLELIPEEYFIQNPFLYYYRGQVKEKISHYTEALDDYLKAERLCEGKVEQHTMHMISAQIIGIYWHIREFNKVIEMSEALLAEVKLEEHKTLAIVHNLLGTALVEQLNRREGVMHLQQALEYCRISGVKNQEAWILNNLCYWDYIPSGKFQEALAGYAKALEIFSEDQSLRDQNLIYANLGALYLLMGEFIKAKEVLAEVERINIRTKNFGGMPACLILQARTEIFQHNFARTEQLLKQIPDPSGLNDFLQSQIFLTYSYLFTEQKDLAQALYWVQEGINVASFRSNYLSMDFLLQKIKIKYLLKEYTEVLQLTAEVRVASEQSGYDFYRTEALFFECVVNKLLGQVKLVSLQEFATLLREKDMYFLLTKYSFLTVEIVDELACLLSKPELIENFLHRPKVRKVDLPERGANLSLTGQILRIQLFGGFTIRCGTEVTTQEEWVSKKAANLLKYLILNRGRLVLQDHVLELFWPDLDISKGRQNMYVAINVIRKTLEPQLKNPKESHYIISQHGYCKFNTQYPYCLDLDDFENYYAEGLKYYEKQYYSKVEEYFFKARHLYKQEFLLENQYDEWCIEYRAQYQKMYLEMLQILFELSRKTDLEQALAYGLEIHALEPYLEIMNLALMQLMMDMGNIKGALDHYEGLKKLYQTELRIAIPESIQALVRNSDSGHL